ncbi:RecF/RecN/SMC N terminal domain-containing protein [Encephalitozoon hellem]|nr:RecF/RecN/SMC N terminal domain-containing protein [Encephalitozoon hellem]
MKLRLESITIHNFKSYRGTHVIQGLDPRFTAIVGANGSGKSNIIDSILFVLGFRARKMRHSSVEGLIYNGDGKEDMCYVELGFNKFRIRREAYLSRKSRYFVDGEEASSAVVMSLLKSEGVDMEHNRFLILQGEIESIAMIKPMDDGLLEYLEDVIGTSEYKEGIEKEEREHRRVTEEYESKSAALKFYGKEYEHIEKKREESLRIVQRKAECLYLDADLQLLCSEKNGRKLSKLLSERKEIEEKLSEIARRNRENGGKVEALERRGTKARERARDSEERFLEARREYQRAERRRRMVEESRDEALRRIEELSREIEEIKCGEDRRRKMRAEYGKEIDRNAEEILRCNEVGERLRSEIDREQRRVEKEAKEKVEEIVREEERMMKLLERKGEIGEKQRSLESKLGGLMSRRSEILGRIEDIEGKLAKIDGKKVASGRDEGVIEREIREIERDLSETRREMSRRMQRVEEYKENEERSSRENEILRRIEHVKGVYGKLSDLGEVESCYEKAFRISGKGLSSIVVDTTCTAEKCISLIKSHGLGRATFIILDRICEVPSLPKESVPYMYSLVKCSPEFRKCFYFALKDTLVCDELEVAKRLAFGKQRKRVVTIDGKLIEKSGVMSGGKTSGRMKSVEELEKACAKMMELRKMKAEELEVIKGLREKGRLCKVREKLSSELEDVMRGIEATSRKINKEEIEKIEVEVLEAKKKVSFLRGVVEGLTDIETRRKKENLLGINERIEMFEKRNLELRLQLESCVETGLKEKEQELEERRRVVSSITIEDISGIRSKMAECESEHRKNSEDLKEILDEIASMKSVLGNDYHMEIDLKNRLDDVDDKSEECRRLIHESRRRAVTLEEEVKRYAGMCNDIYSRIRVEEMSSEEIDEAMRRIGSTITKLRKEEDGEVDMNVFGEYEKAKCEYEKVKEEHEWFKSRLEKIGASLECLKRKRHDEFMEGFLQISKNLKEIYKAITYGGNAELELVDHLDPFSEGVILSVMPPKKSWKSVGNLSGGEKTLSSLALIFALHRYRPSPFYVMDEIDAALDYRNVSVISNFIREMSDTAQFLVISLRSDMFELSETLLGVYKTDNVSRSLVVNIGKVTTK